MTPENMASRGNKRVELTPENTPLLAEYEDHFERSPLIGHSRRLTSVPSSLRAVPGLVSGRLTWAAVAGGGGPGNDRFRDGGPRLIVLRDRHGSHTGGRNAGRSAARSGVPPVIVPPTV